MRAALLASALFLLPGCGSSGPQRYQATGKVTFDGQPVKEGRIMFAPTEPGSAPDEGDIVDGQYAVMVQAGPKRVEIRAAREVPGAESPMDMGPVKDQYIPARYNDQSTLKAEITASGPNQHDFALTSKP